MPGAAGVELPAATRTNGSGAEIFTNRELIAARTAQNGLLIKLLLRPARHGVICAFVVTLITWKPFATAGKLDRNDVVKRLMMGAARFTIDFDAIDFDAVNFYAFRSRGHTITRNDAMTKHAIMTAKPVLKEPVR